MTTDTDTAEALEAAIDAIACRRCDHDDPIGSTDRSALHRAITAHVEAEVARRLAAAPDVEAAIAKYGVQAAGGADTTAAETALRAAIAADKARAVEAADDAAFIRGRDAVRKYPEGWGLVARPTTKEAWGLVDALSDAAYDVGVAAALHADDGWRESVRKRRATARTALLRALGVEA